MFIQTQPNIYPLNILQIHTSLSSKDFNENYFHQKHKEKKIFETHLNPVMLVFIG